MRHSNGNGNHGGEQAALALDMTQQSVTQELTGRVFSVSSGFKLAVVVLFGVLVAGVVGFIIRAADGFDDRAPWGYYAATVMFLITVFGTAPLVAIGFRITKNHFRRPISRAAELFSLVGVLSLLMFIPMILLFPSLEGAAPFEGAANEARRSIWFEVPIHANAPIWLDTFAVIFLVILGLTILCVASLPDMAAMGSRAGKLRRALYGPLLAHWRGTDRQWALHKAFLAVLGAFYFMLIIFVHFLLASDFAMAFVPGWVDSIMPAHHALTGLQAGLGVVLVTAFLLRTVGGYREYISLDVFWSASKILLGLSLLWGYFWFAEFNTLWYGRKPVEQEIIKFTMVDTYKLAFWLNLFGSFLIPFAMLIWNPIRKSILGPTIAGGAAVVGAFFMMVRFYVPAFGVKDITAESVDEIRSGLHGMDPAQLDTIWPGGPDILIIFGGLAGAALIFLLGTRLVPAISLWEIKEWLLYRVVRPVVRGRYVVLGKPE